MKHDGHHIIITCSDVAPRAGAWIETLYDGIPNKNGKSPPVRGRGLKPIGRIAEGVSMMSPPVRGRGLKRITAIISCPLGDVAPRAGAWIETLGLYHLHWRLNVAPRAGAWIETDDDTPGKVDVKGRPPCGGVD